MIVIMLKKYHLCVTIIYISEVVNIPSYILFLTFLTYKNIPYERLSLAVLFHLSTMADSVIHSVFLHIYLDTCTLTLYSTLMGYFCLLQRPSWGRRDQQPRLKYSLLPGLPWAIVAGSC